MWLIVFFSKPTAPAPDDDPRVPPLPPAGRHQPLSGRERTLLAPVPAGTADQQPESKDLLRVSHRTQADGRRPHVRRGR